MTNLQHMWAALLFAVLLQLFQHVQTTSAYQVQVGAGLVSASKSLTSCDDIQEFRCIDDTCDLCAGPNNQGQCRNGVTCAPGQLCNQTPGHCLENTWCTPGRHQMPDASVGTPKHFRCLSVTGLDPGSVLVIYENADFSGDNCLVDSSGVWASPNDAFASSVDADVKGGSFKLCRRPGELTGGSDLYPISADPETGLGTVCLQPTVSDKEDPIPDVKSAFPYVNSTYWYQNGPEDTDNEEVSGKKIRMRRTGLDARGHLVRRGDYFRLDSERTRRIALLTGFLILWREFINDHFTGGLETLVYNPPPEDQPWFGGNSGTAWAADHIVELQIMTNFFNDAANADIQFVWNHMRTCPQVYDVFERIVNTNANLIGIPRNLNSIKGQLFGITNNGNLKNPTWSSYYREELEALRDYLAWINTGLFAMTVARIGDAMDAVYNAAGQAGPSNFVMPGARFRTYAAQALARTIARVNSALQDGDFKDSDNFENDFSQGKGDDL